MFEEYENKYLNPAMKDYECDGQIDLFDIMKEYYNEEKTDDIIEKN